MQETHPVDSESDEGSDENENVNPNIAARTGLVIALKRKWTNESSEESCCNSAGLHRHKVANLQMSPETKDSFQHAHEVASQIEP